MKYRLTYKIRGHEITPDYLLNPIFIIHYFHDCFANYCTDHGLAAFHLQKENKTWIMTEMKIDFLMNMPRWREDVIVETWTRNISPLRTEQDFNVFYKNEILAKGTSRWVIIDEQSRKPVRYEKLTNILHCHPDEVYENYKFRNIPELRGYDLITNDIIRSDEVDFNKHLNSIKYITKAIKTVPEDFLKEHRLSSLSAKYKQESLMGEDLQSIAKQEGKLFKHQLNKSVNDKTEAIFNMISEWEIIC